MDTKSQLFADNQRTVLQYSRALANRYSLPVKELEDEGLSALGLAISSREEHILKSVYWALRKLILYRLRRSQRLTSGLKDSSGIPDPLFALWSVLSDEGRFLVRVILEAPGELIDVLTPRAPKRSKKAVVKHLRKSEGWSRLKVQRVWKEVEESL